MSKVVAEHHLRSSLAGLDHQLVRRHLLPLLLDQQGGARLEEPALLAMVGQGGQASRQAVPQRLRRRMFGLCGWPVGVVQVQSWPDAHNLDILGGKRDLGETSMQATHR